MAEFQDAFKKVKKYGQAAAGLGRGLMSTVGTSGGRAFQQGVSAVQGPLFQAGTQMYGQMRPGSTMRDYMGIGAGLYPSYMRDQMSGLASGVGSAITATGEAINRNLPTDPIVTALPPRPTQVSSGVPRVTSLNDVASTINFPYRTEGRRESTNVVRAPMMTPSEIEAERQRRPFESNPEMRSRMFLPGGIQGPLPESVGQAFDERGRQVPGYLQNPERLRAIADMYKLAGIPIPEAVSRILDPYMQARSTGQLASQLEQQQLAGQGMFAGPTPQERAQFGADVQQQIQQNPSPVNQFMDQEMMGRTREGQAMGLRDLQSAFLSQPMQGGMVRGSTADTMRDREQRLSMLGGMNPPRDVGAESRQTSASLDQTVYDELARQGRSPQQLAEIANLPVAEASRLARTSLAPGTVIRGMGGGGVPFTMVRGPEEDSARREARLSSLPERRERDRLSVQNRLDRMRLGRQTMAANQMAAQQRAIDMATNPLVNPMLVANSPSALAAVFQTQQGQRDFMANAPMRQAELNAQRLQNKASEMMMTPEYRDEQRRNSAIQAFGLLTPEQQNGPIGRYLQSQIVPQTSPPGSVSGPQSIEEASGTVEAIAPSVARILGSDPGSFNPYQILMEVDRRSGTNSPIQGSDLDAIVQYIVNRSRAEPEYVEGGTSGVVGELVRSGKYSPGSMAQQRRAFEDEVRRNSLSPGGGYGF